MIARKEPVRGAGRGKGYLGHLVSSCQLCTWWERLCKAACFLGRNDDAIGFGREGYLDRIGSRDAERRGGGLAAAGEDSVGKRSSELSVCVCAKELGSSWGLREERMGGACMESDC